MDKRFYWIKLKTDFFNTATIDFLMSQKNGCEYVVLYQMLCLQTANTEGTLVSRIGEIIVPYDVNKIVRDTKYFSVDTVTVALELFKQLGLIYKEDNNVLKIADFSEMVGSECSSAKRVREHRERKALQCNTNVTQEIEYRDKSKEIENKDKEKKRFVPPTLDEIELFCKERNNGVDAKRVFDYYNSANWKDGRGNQVKNWKQKIIAVWERSAEKPTNKVGQVAHSVQEYNENIDMEAYIEERRRRGV